MHMQTLMSECYRLVIARRVYDEDVNGIFDMTKEAGRDVKIIFLKFFVYC